MFRVVSFQTSESERGLAAVGVRVLDGATVNSSGLVAADKLASEIEAVVQQKLAMAGTDGVPIPEMIKEIVGSFRGYEPLQTRLRMKSLNTFLSELPGVALRGRYPRQRLTVLSDRELGRLGKVAIPVEKKSKLKSSETTQRVAGTERNVAAPPELLPERKVGKTPLASSKRSSSDSSPHSKVTVDDLINKIIETLNDEGPKTLQALGTKLSSAFPGPGRLPARFGLKSFTALMLLCPGIVIEDVGANRIARLVRPRDDVSLESLQMDIFRLVWAAERRGDTIHTGALGVLLSKTYGSKPMIHKRLGYSSLGKLLASVPGIALYGDGPNHFIKTTS
jgi:hypothetical protein